MPNPDDLIPIPPITPGVARALSPLMRRIAAEGEGEEFGLNSYLVGIDEIVVVDPGPADTPHLDVLTGCGGDRIRWIVCTSIDDKYAGGAKQLQERTGAELVMPGGFDGADSVLGDGYKIDATEFRVTTVAIDNGGTNFVFVLEQERSMIVGDHLEKGTPKGLADKVKSYRIRAAAPAFGQYIEDVTTQLKKS